MSDDWISCGDAYEGLRTRFDTLKPLTIQKALIGMIKENALPVICTEYDETASVRHGDGAEKSRNPYGPYVSPPMDFWHYGLAVQEDAGRSFQAGIFANEIELNACDLPYRFFKGKHANAFIEAQLFQMARGVRFFQPRLDALTSDRRWSVVWPLKAEPKAPGRAKAWAWDEVKAVLTVRVAQSPDLLSGQAIQIVKVMQELFEIIHDGASPDKSDLFEYAERIIHHALPDEQAP